MTTTRTTGPLHFEDLEPHRFEDLVRQLIYDFRPWRRLEATGRSGADESFDSRGWEMVGPDVSLDDTEDTDPEDRVLDRNPDRIWLIQCKRERSIGPTKITTYLEEIPEDEVAGLHGVIFAAACDFSKKTRDNFRDKCRSLEIDEWHLWGKAEIEDRLFRPSNDHLLFAYFGFSLKIRQRSLKTAISSRLTIKRRALKHVQLGASVLIRDASETRYPYLDRDSEKPRAERGRWLIRDFRKVRHDGLRFLVQRQLAFLDDDGIHWDRAEAMDDAKRRPFHDPWRDVDAIDARAVGRQAASDVWNSLEEKNKAWFELYADVLFDSIVAIDETGDEFFSGTHLYTGEWTLDAGPFAGGFRASIDTIDEKARRLRNPDANHREEIFNRDGVLVDPSR